jgi:predicted AAA+ superfamily ATPase
VLARYIFSGGFPELLLRSGHSDDSDQSALLRSQQTLKSDAVDRVIWKDIPQAFKVENPMTLERLTCTLAGQIGGVMSPQSICQTVRDMTPATFDRYLRYLELAFMVFTLQNYAPTEEARQRRGRKLYFVDPAVRNAALQRGLTPLTDPQERGLLYENAGVSHAHALSQQSGVRLYYWRDKQAEVDLIYDHPRTPLAFEFASSVLHHRSGLRQFISRFPRFQGTGYLVAPGLASATPPDGATGRIGQVSLELFLIAAGMHAERELEARLKVH